MTAEQASEALQVGIDVVTEEEIEAASTWSPPATWASATRRPRRPSTAAITGLPVAEVTGRGTGVDDAGLARKIAAIEAALAVNRPDPGDAFDVLCKVGGLEIAGLAGVIIGAAARGVPVVIDGFISGAAALVAVGLVPDVKPYLIASHRSVERGHQAVLDHLGLPPALRPRPAAGRGHRRGAGLPHGRGRGPHPQRDGDLRRGRG